MPFSNVQPTYDFEITLVDEQLEYDFQDTGVDWNFWHMTCCRIAGMDWKDLRKARIVGNLLKFTLNPYSADGKVATIYIRRASTGSLPQVQVVS